MSSSTRSCVCSNGTIDNEEEEPPITVQVLMFDSQGIIDMVEWNAREYEETHSNVRIEIRRTKTMAELYEEIESDARTGGGLFDGYFTNPVILGTAAVLDGFLDLSEDVKTSRYSDWTDVLPVFRTHVTNFQDKIYLILLDGDTHALFYRRDILDYFGFTVPRTWDEYIQVARELHGKTYENITLSGSCVSRIEGDHAMYWAHLVLSTFTQTRGTHSGSLFDTKDLAPLTGVAMAEMLRIHEEMALYGTPDEFDKILNDVQNAHINDGSCVLTFSWGDLYKRSRAQGSMVGDKLGIAATPGSQKVLDRTTGELVECDEATCPYGRFYEDIGWVNYAPYAANGGWGGAISANTRPEKQQVLVDFFLWASGKQQSQKYVIPNATLPIQQINGQDPWRKSHLDVQKWVDQGFTAELAYEYVNTILHNTQSKNVVVDIKFPKGGEIMSVLDKQVHRHLVRAVKENSIVDKQAERMKVANEVTRKWNTIISAYNARGDTVAPILEVYQRLRGVYVPNQEFNYIDNVRPVGYSLFAIIAVFCLMCGGWVVLKRESRVVRSSQPPFLLLLCVGVFVLGSTIIPMGIDDSVASTSGCNVACVATPWLAAMGFTVTFSTLFSKIWRFSLVYKNAVRFRKVIVTIQDVILPLIIMLTLNAVLLTIWTVLDPPRWNRVVDGRDDSGAIVSYGRCKSEGHISLIMLSLLVVVNLAALVLANVQAYKTRHISSEFSESQYIGLSMISMIQAFLIGLPVLIIARSNPTANFIVGSLLIFVSCMSIQGLIFIPKYRMLNSPEPQSDTGNSSRRLSVLSSRFHHAEMSQSRVSFSLNSNVVETSEQCDQRGSDFPPRIPSVAADSNGSNILEASQSFDQTSSEFSQSNRPSDVNSRASSNDSEASRNDRSIDDHIRALDVSSQSSDQTNEEILESAA